VPAHRCRGGRASRSLVIGLACAAALGLSTAPAHADPSSWLFLGGGASRLESFGSSTEEHGLFQFEAGLGSPADANIVAGGMFKTFTFFGRGTDLALALRGATGGFVRGGFGLALDLGGYQRFWERGSTGFAGALVLGAPYGLQAAIHAELGSNEQKTYAVAIGIDFLRLTVFREPGQNWLPNPFPGFASR
jgi:hypothetical protein